MSHIASEDLDKRQFILTYDQLRNLYFESAAYACYKDGQSCGYIEFDPYYIATPLLDLKKATVQRLAVHNETGYRVFGDQTTWVSNGTEDLSFELGRGRVEVEGESASPCLDQPDYFIW